MKLRWSRSAFEDVSAILDHLASENPLAAARLVRRLDTITARIVRFPDGAQRVAERPGIRRIPLVRYPYAVFYLRQDDEVVILRVLHAARDKPWEEL